ncbi:mucin-3B [Culicoides brevitarsis]|uniref:mucin-3B n=1 Tax=Culicoides brevitarsis TaxID=469753 RepID=UPI00307BBE3C
MSSQSDSDVRPTPTLRLSDQDVTTVLLVDTKDRAAHGKFFNIKPEVGLLKSTARTFIQEGVTTEYATQVVGTTLENGLYAQLLATTSRVLYDHDNGATKIPALQYHQYNEITPVDQKDQWNGQFIKNTDYISPNNPFVVYPSRHNYDAFVANRQAKELERNVVTIGQHELLPESQAQVAPRRESPSESLVSSESNSAKVEEIISPKKVIPDSNLPTFTVSNVFAPSAFTADDEIVTERNSPTTKSDRIAKVLFRGGVPEQDLKHLSTVTYYGFADFTTIVGDTMIVFSPSTAAPATGGQATSIRGEATLQESVVTSTKTFVSHEREMVTETVPKNDVVMQTKIPTFVVEPVTPSRDSKEMEDEEDYDTTTNPYTTSESTESSEEELVKKLNVLSREQDVSKYDTTTPTMDEEEITTNENTTPKVFNVTPEQIEPSEVAPVADKPTLSKPSNEDILKALASLQAKVEKSSETPEKVIQTGVTTIFFDDDPFAIQPTEVVTTAKASEKAETTTEKQQETTDKVETTTENKSVTEGLTEKPETTTEADEKTTTEKGTTFPTTLDVTTEKSAEELLREAEVEKALRKIKAKEALGCKDDVEIIPSTVFKTLTYLTTFFIPDDTNPDSTSTSIKSNAKVSTSVHYASQCIEATNVVTEAAASVADETTTLKATTTEDDSTESTSTTAEDVTEAISTTESNEEEEKDTTLSNDIKGTTEIVTTKMHVTEEPLKITTEKPEKKDEEDEETEDYDSDEEIDVIYKTLYTTYTYLTTFFVDQTTSVSSRKEVVTNVITQTLDPNENSDLIALINDMAVDKTASAIQPTKSGKELIHPNTATDVGVGRPTTTFNIPESDLIGINQLLVEQGLLSATPALDEKYYLETAGPKTLFTTYTYFTTVFVDGETEISSRTEVFTNILNNDVTPTAKPSEIVDATEYVQKKDNDVLDSSSDEQSIVKDEKKPEEPKKANEEDRLDDDNKIDNEIVQPKYSTMVRNPTSSEQSDDVVTMVTDVKSSSSLGGKQFIDRIDQESSESNNEEVLPSPQLLLQTSYTTFTYFTTLFNPSASTSKIESRLETITNIVTETLNPTQTLQLSDDSAPITYYTTFTYWTTLFKDGSTTTTSREETISNVVNPTAVVKFDSSSTDKIDATSVVVPANELQTVQASEGSSSEDADKKVSSTAASIEPTTYYTTYTYFTTSYVGDETVLNSRFETITNIVTPTPVLEVPAKVVPFSPVQDPLKPTGVLYLNEGKIVDADGISSILYTTKTIGTVIDDTYTQVVESSSKVQVDEVKKALKTSETEVTPGNRKTGLVRLYDGTIVANRTTTFYQSKVIGTYIDEKYAQIIESTSSFVIEKTVEPSNVNGLSIEPTATVGLDAAKSSISPTPAVLAGSISDAHDDSENEDHDEDEDDDEEGSGKSRLSYTPKKPSFTPVIRPFASRPRPTFNPAKKNRGGATSAQTITRSDITPTITATPTVKAESSSRNRFGGRRSSSALNNAIQSSSAASVASGANSSSRRFSRPGRISATASLGGGLASSSRVRPTSSVNRIQPTVNNLASSRRGGLRSSSVQPRINLSSAGFAGNSRFNRIRPTASLQGTSPSTAGITTTPNDFTESPDVITHEVTQTATDESVEEEVVTTTENSRRRGNPLLNFRRPPISRAPGTAAGNGPTSRPAAAISTRRNPLTRTSQRTTTTTTTTTARPKARAFSRPSPLPIAPIGNRPRPAGSNLFPPRSLLRTTQAPKPTEPEEQENENEEADDTENDFHDDTDQEGSNIEEQVVEQAKPEPAKAVSNTPNIRPFSGLRRRSKRQVDYGTRYQSRYQAQRKPKVQTVDYYYDDETEAPPKATSRTTQSRFRSRSTQQPQTNNRIRPTSASSSQSRSQFTLRDNSNSNSRTSNFRRPQTIQSSSNRRASTRSSSRYNQYSNTNNRNTQRPRTTISGRRTSSRTRAPKVDPYIPQNDGTITVTHHIPTETKIPIVNNGHTEYKNIITEKTSVEVLGPKQYYTSTDPMGKVVTLLSSDMTAVNGNGLTEVTQFVLFESPTSSVIFTPTTIRGRRTSFSHIIPSTVYDVHPTVSTQNVGLAANAPLANILLSQLLLGNVGLPLQQQQTINPLLSFQQQPQPQIANTPMTEYKVRTTMYETTLTSATSTVLPLTFHGKQILTTIVETSTNVITATEFITDTIVVTPTATAQNQQQQLNSLLLPLLLQQAPQIQQPLASQETGILNQIPDTQESLEQDEKQFDNIQSIRDDNSRSKEVDEYDTYDDLAVKKPVEKPKVNPLKNFKKYENKKQEQFKPVSVAAPKTSVVTLYVSGRRPGEFSTVLSTYVVGEDSAVSKRSANYVEVVPSRLSTLNKKTEIDDLVDIYQAEASNNIDEFYLAGTNEISLDPSHEQQRLYDSETASLESVLGDFSQYYVPESRNDKKQATSYFLGFDTNVNRFKRTTDNDDYDDEIDENTQQKESPINTHDNIPRRKVLRVVKRKPKLLTTTSSNSFVDQVMSTLVINPTRKRIAITRKKTRTENISSTLPEKVTISPTKRIRKVLRTKKRLLERPVEEQSEHDESDILSPTPTTPPTPIIYTTETHILDTVTTTTTRQRTYTYVVTRVNDGESVVMSSTSVKDHIGPATLTVTRTISLTITIPPIQQLKTRIPV